MVVTHLYVRWYIGVLRIVGTKRNKTYYNFCHIQTKVTPCVLAPGFVKHSNLALKNQEGMICRICYNTTDRPVSVWMILVAAGANSLRMGSTGHILIATLFYLVSILKLDYYYLFIIQLYHVEINLVNKNIVSYTWLALCETGMAQVVDIHPHCKTKRVILSLQWRHFERDGVSSHRCIDWLSNHLSRRRSKKISKLRVTGLCAKNLP